MLSAQVPGQPEIPPQECDCPVQRVIEHYCFATEIFLGTVSAADTVFKRAEVGRWERDNIDHISVGFLVEHVFKGEPAPMKNVLTATDPNGNCGFSFIAGTSYMVFARADGDQLITDQCSGTRMASVVGRQFSDSLDHLMNGGTYEIGGVDHPGPDCP
jgi:hypothetical protein